MFRKMLRYKTSKQTFIIAALAILLCLLSLTGATFALFTNSLSDGTIGVITTAGNVDVDIVDATDTGYSLVGEALMFQTTAEQQKILFEPGATFRTQGFKIKNAGNVPINFHMYVSKNEQSKIDGTENDNIDLETFKETFDVWISTDPNDASNATPIDSFVSRLETEFSVEGNLSETYYLYVRMKETAGNEYQGKEYTGIGITVYATQGNVAIEE